MGAILRDASVRSGDGDGAGGPRGPRGHGFPLGQHVPADPADHAEDFAHRYAEPLDWQAGIRMEELGIPKDRIGSNDHLHGLLGRAFNPFER